MITGYLYQDDKGKFYSVHVHAALNIFQKEATIVINMAEKIVCRWTVKRK